MNLRTKNAPRERPKRKRPFYLGFQSEPLEPGERATLKNVLQFAFRPEVLSIRVDEKKDQPFDIDLEVIRFVRSEPIRTLVPSFNVLLWPMVRCALPEVSLEKDDTIELSIRSLRTSGQTRFMAVMRGYMNV